jgi:hypothetical protein
MKNDIARPDTWAVHDQAVSVSPNSIRVGWVFLRLTQLNEDSLRGWAETLEIAAFEGDFMSSSAYSSFSYRRPVLIREDQDRSDVHFQPSQQSSVRCEQHTISPDGHYVDHPARTQKLRTRLGNPLA